MQKGFAPILIVVFIALALGGYLIYQKQTKPIPAPQQITQPSPITTDETVYTEASRSANPDSIGANWKTYTKDKFSFKYPGNWSVLDRTSAYKGGVSTVLDAQFFNFQNKDNMKNGNWMEMLYDTSLDGHKINQINNQQFVTGYFKAEIVSTILDNKKLYKVTTTSYEKKEGSDKELYKLYRIYIPMKMGYIQLSSTLGIKEILDQILFTFKFTN